MSNQQPNATTPSGNSPGTTPVWCLAWESASSGASEWRRSRADADALFANWLAQKGADDSLALWVTNVPSDASPETITRIVDMQMWAADYVALRYEGAALTA